MQTGARMHYAIPRMLEKEGKLFRFYTDRHYNRKHPIVRLSELLPFLKKLNNTFKRYEIDDIPTAKVKNTLVMGIMYALSNANLSLKNRTTFKIHHFKNLSKQIIQNEKSNLKAFDTVFGFDTEALEFFRWSKKEGKRIVMEQCVAARNEQLEANLLFNPSFDDTTKGIMHSLHAREKEEWELADMIVCPSLYVKESIVKSGVNPDKINIVPYGYSNPHASYEERLEIINSRKIKSDKKIDFLFVGNDFPRKGLFDLLEVFEKLPENCRLNVAGFSNGINVSSFAAVKSGKVNILGKLNQEELRIQYEKSDIFILPSYLEGSATVVYEAMSWGLPCIVTLETGSIIEEGKTGVFVKRGDVESIQEACKYLMSNDMERLRMGEEALEVSQEYTLDRYKERVMELIVKNEIG